MISSMCRFILVSFTSQQPHVNCNLSSLLISILSMVRNRKRKHAQCTQDLTGEDRTRNNGSLASTLGRIRTSDSSQDLQNLSEKDNGTSSHNENEAREQRKRRKKNDTGKDNSHGQKLDFPSLTFTALHKLHSSIKIADLQSLILYCIADGIGPQWVSVQSRQSIKKAVVLFIPGLEIRMFDGSITLDHISKTQDDGQLGEGSQEANGKTEDTSTSHVTSMLANHDNGFHKVTTSPDAFMPVQMNVNTLPDPLKPLADMFTHLWPVKAPGDQRLSRVYSPLHAMLTSPIPKTQEDKIKDKETKGAKPAREEKYWENQRTPITAFISPREELSENEYTAHPALFTLPHEKEQELLRRKAAGEEIGWVDTLVDKLEDGDVAGSEIEQGSLTAGRTVLAMDCEMCIVEGGEYALTRISLIDWDESMIMDELVKPDKPIIDYLTPYSGITSAKLNPITTTLGDIQSRLLNILNPHTIIVGHSLNADLAALKLTHPFIVDTSILYQHPRGPPMKSALRWLAQKYLRREIQKGHGKDGHDSIEDALACLDLVKMKCERGPKWGTFEATGESIFKRLLRTPNAGKPLSAPGEGKNGAIIDHGAPEKNFGSMASFCIGCASDVDVVQGIQRAVLGDADGKLIPGGGVDFTWARFRELESLRGWSTETRPPADIIPLDQPPGQDPSPAVLGAAVSRTIQHIKTVRDFLPPCTLLVVYTGTGDPREMKRLQDMQRAFKKEFAVKKWDELSVKWTDKEEQDLKKAAQVARKGLGLMAIV